MVEVERICERVVFVAKGGIVADRGILTEITAASSGTVTRRDVHPLGSPATEHRTASRAVTSELASHQAVSRRHAIVSWRSPHRWFDVAAPAIDSILFGSLAVFVAEHDQADGATVPMVLTGLLLFHILFASRSPRFQRGSWRRPGPATCST